jgi:rhodanese-related sulfurtransferase
MEETSPKKEKGNSLEWIVAIVLVIITIIASIYLLYPSFFPDSQNNVYEGYVQNYINISVADAYDIMNTTTDINLSIIDVRGLEGCGTCQFKNKGHLPGAVLNSNPNTLFNSTAIFIIYSVDGTVGANFSQQLVNHVYGKIYNLEGGIEAWRDAGFELEYGSS